MMRKIRSSRGQALLVVVITMIVALTVGLTLATRTITNLKISKQNEDSQRAFQAATSGIEKYIQSPTSQNTGQFTGSSFTTNVDEVSGETILLNNGDNVDQDRGLDVWLSAYPDFSNRFSGTINVYWDASSAIDCSSTNPNKGKTPALELIILTGTVTNPTYTKRVFDPCNSGVSGTTNRGNNFEIPQSTR